MTNPQPADERVFTDEALGFELFWQKYKNTLLAGLAVALVCVVVAVGWLIHRHSTKLAAEAALMGASTAQELREVAEKYAGFAAGRTARMVLAARLAAEGNATAASAEYQAFVSSFPESPLAGPARIALATLALADGQQKRGLDLLNEASASGDAFTAQMGLLFKAREQIAAGDFAGARNALQLLVTSHGLSPAARVSQGLFQQIAAIDPQQGIASAAEGAQPSLRISAPQPSQP